MKRHLNTLYVTTQGAWLALDGEAVTVRIDGEIASRVPLLALGGIVCFGASGVSPPLMAACAEHSVELSFLTEHGRFLSRVVGSTSGNVLLRREQYRWADDDDRCRTIAVAIIASKVANARGVLLRAIRDRSDSNSIERLRDAAGQMTALLGLLETASSTEQARGYEGAAARTYFRVFDDLIVQQKDGFGFSGRTRRPPLDNVNALLSFAYTLLLHDVTGALESVGLDPAVGYLHGDRPGRPGLALDLMEEFRAIVADRLVLSLINLRQVDSSQFERAETGGVTMNEAARKTMLVAYQKRKSEEIVHPFLEEKTTVGLLPHIQALLLARHLRGDLDAYPPMVWK